MTISNLSLSKPVAGMALVACLLISAGADDSDAKASAQTKESSSESKASADGGDDMASFRAVIDRVVDDAARDGATPADADAPSDTGDLHDRHLGLGFGHGKPAAPGVDGTRPLLDVCYGDGHAVVYNDGGNGIGRRDCGDPSPSD